jgi:[pyruvate, water dikinase]-phosphate phosphotransferase / [pyruvate, water dikinase] kinase
MLSAETTRSNAPWIYIVSGGIGTSGEQLVNTVLAQFPEGSFQVATIGNVRQVGQVAEGLAQAKTNAGLLVHTLVDAQLRAALTSQAQALEVTAIDLMGPLMTRLESVLGQPPLGQPGRYRQMNRPYFERVAAIEYTLAHDDGQKPEDWPAADVLLVGVSRTGKTPLSVYLSILGWKVANYPLVPEITPPVELFQIDPARVIGLTIDIDRLLTFRRQRTSLLGISSEASYADPEQVDEELRTARRIFRQGGFFTLNVTERTLEASADEVIRHINRPTAHPAA